MNLGASEEPRQRGKALKEATSVVAEGIAPVPVAAKRPAKNENNVASSVGTQGCVRQ